MGSGNAVTFFIMFIYSIIKNIEIWKIFEFYFGFLLIFFIKYEKTMLFLHALSTILSQMCQQTFVIFWILYQLILQRLLCNLHSCLWMYFYLNSSK